MPRTLKDLGAHGDGPTIEDPLEELERYGREMDCQGLVKLADGIRSLTEDLATHPQAAEIKRELVRKGRMLLPALMGMG